MNLSIVKRSSFLFCLLIVGGLLGFVLLQLDDRGSYHLYAIPLWTMRERPIGIDELVGDSTLVRKRFYREGSMDSMPDFRGIEVDTVADEIVTVCTLYCRLEMVDGIDEVIIGRGSREPIAVFRSRGRVRRLTKSEREFLLGLLPNDLAKAYHEYFDWGESRNPK